MSQKKTISLSNILLGWLAIASIMWACVAQSRESDGWIILFKDPKGDGSCQIGDLVKQFESYVQKNKLSVVRRFTMTTLYCGVSVTADTDDNSLRKKILRLPYVSDVTAMSKLKLDAPLVVRQDDFVKSAQSAPPPSGSFSYNIHKDTGVERLHKELGLSGKGIKIGIIDSGVDHTNPELGNCWKTKNCPFQYGADLVGSQSSGTQNPTPMDTCNGHGTHVAGIIAGQGPYVNGVAPNATLGMYRVIGCNGQVVSDDVVIMGMELAYRDGMDIINLSLGDLGWRSSPISEAASNLVSKGVIVVTSSGNYGATGLFTAIAPSIGSNVIGVGSTFASQIVLPTFNIKAPSGTQRMIYMDNQMFPYNIMTDKPLVLSKDASGGNSGCSMPAQPEQVKGKVLVAVRSSQCAIVDRALIAQKAGAIGLLMIHDQDSIQVPVINSSTQIPVAMVRSSDGQKILSALGSSPDSVTVSPGQFVSIPNTSGSAGTMDPTSAWGPTPELFSAPSLAAPGAAIFSTFLTSRGVYATRSGTSMAAPYISGVIALILEARKKTIKDTNTLKNLVIQSSVPLQSPQSNSTKLSVLKQGSGFINAYSAVTTPIVTKISTMNLNYTTSTKEFGKTLTIYNIGSSPAVVTVNHLPSESVTSFNSEGTFVNTPIADSTSSAKVKFSGLSKSNTITIPAGKSYDLTVKFTPPSKFAFKSKFWFYSGYITLTTKAITGKDSVTQTVSYFGLLGNYMDYPFFYDSKDYAPALYYNNRDPVVEDSKYDINPSTSFLVTYQNIRPTKLLKIQIINKKTYSFYGWVLGGYYQNVGVHVVKDSPSYSSVKNSTVYKDNKALKPKQIEPGKYKVKISALKVFGNPDKLEDFNTWSSPVFYINKVDSSVPTIDNDDDDGVDSSEDESK
ncbi:hypothetical protein H4219_002382 [Mycoemilia scoparia]|uniref:Uncharacterized protein n=1 Tax=Mycoemilia scoparia TaxID=417184 RepID=A0A9W7ZYE2_9FUNG|nr:hypothetical protein H4219_002382 [Mycoemilia scoparia]